MDLHELTVNEVAAKIRRGDLDAHSYAAALLDRCEAARSLNAFLLIDPEQVLEQARTADRLRREGAFLGPLHGIPLSVKDCIDVSGLATTAGTPALQNNIRRRTAPVLQRLFDAGALLLGKTNMPEVAYHVTSENTHAGAVRNPYSPTHTPGGSSGGTAAAVAARLSPAGLGTDTTGSVRIPAAFCGIAGFRPSTGRYPSAGIVPMNHTRDTAGFMARSVNDIALLDEVVTGQRSESEPTLEGLRLGIPRDYFFADLDDRVASILERELQRLEDLGVTLVEAVAPDFAEARSKIVGPIMAWEMVRDMQEYLANGNSNISFEEIVAAVASPHVKAQLERVLESAHSLEAEQGYQEVIREAVPAHRAEYVRYFRDNRLQAIAFPTSPLVPPLIGETETTSLNGREVSIWKSLRNAVPASIAGAPGLTLPIGLANDGLPVGLELDGVPGCDRELLAIGQSWERVSEPFPAPDL